MKKTSKEILNEIDVVIALNKEVRAKCNTALTDAFNMIVHNTYEIRSRLDEEYQKGVNDSWNVAKNLIEMDDKKRCDIFGNLDIKDIMKTNSSLEIMGKITSYKEEKANKENKIIIGDIVRSKEDGTIAIILDYDLSSDKRVGENWIVYTEYSCVEYWGKDDFVKTYKKANMSEYFKQF